MVVFSDEIPFQQDKIKLNILSRKLRKVGIALFGITSSA